MNHAGTNNLQLVFPLTEHKQDALDYRQEHFDIGEYEINGDGGLDKTANYEDWLKKITDNVIHDDGALVPATTYFGIAGSEIIGTIQIRHKLNESLIKTGDHIGYSIRPSKQRKGYATKMLSLALEKCRGLGIDKVLITCDKNNLGSAKTILKNGGMLENEITEENGNIVQRYWISIGAK